MNLDLDPAHLRIVCDILTQFVPDRAVWAFGSRVTGKARAYSDLDLAVVGDTPMPPPIGAALAEAFSESELPFKVDVVDWASTSPAFREIIKSGHIAVQDKGNP